MRYRYPRTPHLPDSPGATDDDDDRLARVDHFGGLEVVVTEKLDGENTSLYPDAMHARSPDGRHHPSQSLLRARHAAIAHQIPTGWRVCGENLYARHSIAYAQLPAPFFVFAVFDESNVCLSWDDTQAVAECLGLPLVPVRARGVWSAELIASVPRQESVFGGPCEGFVVRVARAFPWAEHNRNVAKWVRAGHVQTDEHWRTAWVPNHVSG